MAKRRGDSPLTILVMGIFTIGLFGGFVAWFGNTKPILLLEPILEKKYSSQEFRTSFVPSRDGLRSYIVVEVPPHLASTQDRLKIGAFSLDEYYELTEGVTQVEACRVTVKGQPSVPTIVVDETLMKSEATTRKAIADLEALLKEQGLLRPRITVVGLQPRGTEIKVHGVAADPKSADTLAKAVIATLLQKASSISLIKLTVKARGKPNITLVGGLDAPKRKPGTRPTNPRKRPPQKRKKKEKQPKPTDEPDPKSSAPAPEAPEAPAPPDGGS